MYFLMIRPQRRRMRDQQAMQSSLEVGDEVMTDVGHLRLHHRVRGRPVSGSRSTTTCRSASTAASSRARSTPAARRAAPAARRRSTTVKGDAAETRERHRRPTPPTHERMSRRRLWASLLGCVGITVVLLLLNLAFRQHARCSGSTCRAASRSSSPPRRGRRDDDLLVIRDLIRDELENRGIAEPDVRVEGSNIVVDLPGVKDQREALDAVDVAGIVTLRPVLQCVAGTERGTTTSTVPGSSRSPGRLGARLDGAPTRRRRAGDHVDDDDAGGAGRLRPTRTPAADDRRRRRRPRRPPPTTTADAVDDGAVDHARRRPLVPATARRRQSGDDRAAHARRRPVPRRPARRRRRGVFERDSADVELDQQARAGPSSSASAPAARRRGTPSPPSATTARDVPERPAGDRPRRRRAVGPDGQPSRRSPASVSITGDFERGRGPLARRGCSTAAPSRPTSRSGRVDTVSPTLGEDSLRASIFAGLVGIALLLLSSCSSSTAGSRCSSPPG